MIFDSDLGPAQNNIYLVKNLDKDSYLIEVQTTRAGATWGASSINYM